MMDGARWDFVNENDNDESLLSTPVQFRHQVGNGDNEPSFNSYQETSFDSEGFGQKVADYRVELTRLESAAAITTTPPTTRYQYSSSDGSSTTHATTPASASKFIERSLHDLDDLINQRRQELSELKKTNRQRLEATPAPPANANGVSRGSTGFGAVEMSPAVVSLSRAAYDELKDSERSLQQKLKAEQLHSKQLEDDVVSMESQCAAHAEWTKVAMGERNRCRVLEVLQAEKDGEIRALSEELDYTRQLLQVKSAKLEELDRAPGPDGADHDASVTAVSQLSAHASPRLPLTERFGQSGDLQEGISAVAYEQMYEQYLTLQAEAQQWQQQHEQFEAVVDEWEKKVEVLEEARRISDLEKAEANNVAYQWQSEAMHFECQVAAKNGALVQTQQELSQWQARLQATELQLAQAQAQAQALQQQLQEKEAESRSIPSPHTPQQPARQNQPLDHDGTNQPSHDDFWMDNGNDAAGDSFSAMKSPQSLASSSSTTVSASALSSSAAKRILLTWDKTMVERNKVKNAQKSHLARAKVDRSISRTAFLITMAFFQMTVWVLLLVSSYFYFYNFRSCTVDEIRLTH